LTGSSLPIKSCCANWKLRDKPPEDKKNKNSLTKFVIKAAAAPNPSSSSSSFCTAASSLVNAAQSFWDPGFATYVLIPRYLRVDKQTPPRSLVKPVIIRQQSEGGGHL
jgi:hypothetical protein